MAALHPHRRYRGGLAVLLVAWTLLPCAPALARDNTASPGGPDAACAALQARADLNITLLFGLRRPDGTRVTRRQWRIFLRDVVTPQFPDGLTVVHGDGQWRDRQSGQVRHEPARVVWIVTPALPDLAGRIGTIRNEYRRRFGQQSVGVVAGAGCDAF